MEPDYIDSLARRHFQKMASLAIDTVQAEKNGYLLATKEKQAAFGLGAVSRVAGSLGKLKMPKLPSLSGLKGSAPKVKRIAQSSIKEAPKQSIMPVSRQAGEHVPVSAHVVDKGTGQVIPAYVEKTPPSVGRVVPQSQAIVPAGQVTSPRPVGQVAPASNRTVPKTMVQQPVQTPTTTSSSGRVIQRVEGPGAGPTEVNAALQQSARQPAAAVQSAPQGTPTPARQPTAETAVETPAPATPVTNAQEEVRRRFPWLKAGLTGTAIAAPIGLGMAAQGAGQALALPNAPYQYGGVAPIPQGGLY